ncbi:aldehyde dehydrogenase family protein [Nitratireductor kimnyeongensis]|uniref:Aldehyde dehydrogenase family protein n=1 Tax=Nitratireductor kimnyeongensis TaxID=430679 RepID=A0ABW0T9D4_9HYPH|nr:aldehyde dehydrogenase family protein [Nitratireductor kimnyeongensis]QZZ36159.1 aldehyde dehydrogenase family protein [Nitratireductor kimnyeongensis]
MDSIRIANHYIGGVWIEDAAEGILATTNPADGTEASRYRSGSPALVNQAVAAARTAFEKGGWAARPRLRSDVLLAMADAVEARRGLIKSIAIAESGKLGREIDHELNAAVSELRYYAGLSRLIFGRVQEIDEGQQSIYAREPGGVAGVIVPWNAPITLLIRSLAPALAAGCTTVVKPAPQTSLTNAVLMETLAVEGVPAGVLNSVNESGDAVGRAMAEHGDIDIISFTGSVSTGKAIMRAAADTLKRLALELGGKTPAVVFADANIENSVATIVRCATVMAGQMCTAVSRVLVEAPVYDQVASAIAQRLSKMRLGPGTDPASDMGPMIDIRSRDRIAALLDEAAAEGDVIVRGEVREGKGAFIAPSLVAINDLSSKFVQEELFGPLLVIERFEGEAEAIAKANATRLGLAASLWTADLARAQRVARALKFGTVWINSHNRLFAEAETGGFKQSGLGRMHGVEALNDFLETKHIFSEAN